MKKKKSKKALVWFGIIDAALILGVVLFLIQSGVISIGPFFDEPEEYTGYEEAEIAEEPYDDTAEWETEDEGEEIDPDDYENMKPTKRCLVDSSFWDGCPERDVQLLTPNIYSRPQYALEEVSDIVIHYVANPGTTAQQNRDYFEDLKDGKGRSVSSHFVIGLEGEIIQCISCSEWSYASNHRNFDTISIECCHPDLSGRFTDATYESVVKLTAWLCGAFEIGPEHVIRHYDVTGKNCPKYFVENTDAWEQLLADVKDEYNLIYG